MAGKISFLVLRCRLRVKLPTSKAISSPGWLGALWMVPVPCWAIFLFRCVVTRTVKFFPVRLSRKGVESPSLEISKTTSGKTLLEQGGWTN